MEQTGTDVDCSGRTPEYYGWYEMYPAYPVNFPNTVRPGDPQGWTQTVVKNQSGLARSSAEVIVEAPSASSGVLPLADFGTVNLSSSLVNGSAISTFSGPRSSWSTAVATPRTG